MGVVRKIREAVSSRFDDDPAELAVEIERVRAEGLASCAERDKLTAERALAETFEDSERIDAAVKRSAWQIDRAGARLSELEDRLAVASAATKMATLRRHRVRMAAIYPRLRAAITAAIEIQSEAVAARDAAVKELGSEHAVDANIPRLVYQGLLFQDLFSLWTTEQDRVWSAPWSAPAPPLRSAPLRAPMTKAEVEAARELPTVSPRQKSVTRPGGDRPKPAAAPAPRPLAPIAKRALRHDPEPNAGERQVLILRSHSRPEGGDHIVGDRVNLPADRAMELVQRALADFV